MMLRGLLLSRLKLADGRVHPEKRDCVECERNEEVEDFSHWLLLCPRWESERWHLLTRFEERLPNVASLIDIQSAAITDLACEDHGIAQLIYLDCKIWCVHFDCICGLFTYMVLMCILDRTSWGLYPSTVLQVCTLMLLILID